MHCGQMISLCIGQLITPCGHNWPCMSAKNSENMMLLLLSLQVCLTLLDYVLTRGAIGGVHLLKDMDIVCVHKIMYVSETLE